MKEIIITLEITEEVTFTLLPCPFCGKGDLEMDDLAVYCNECDIHGPAGDGEKEAITYWNKRVERKYEC